MSKWKIEGDSSKGRRVVSFFRKARGRGEGKNVSRRFISSSFTIAKTSNRYSQKKKKFTPETRRIPGTASASGAMVMRDGWRRQKAGGSAMN
jgi:hypothetical protein